MVFHSFTYGHEKKKKLRDQVLVWNRITLNALATDHSSF